MRFHHIRTIVAKQWMVYVLLLVALFLRLWNIYGTATFLGDQGRDALIMRDILLAKHFPAIGPPTSIGQIYMGPFFYYFMAPWLGLFMFNPVGLAVGTALLSVCGLVVYYIILLRFTNKRTALFGLFFAVFSYTLTEYARFSWNPNLLPYLSFALIGLIALHGKKPSKLIALSAGILMGITLQFHLLSILLIIPLIGLILVRKQWKSIAFLFIGASMVLIPLLVFDVRHNFLNVKNAITFLRSPGGSMSTTYIEALLATMRGYVYSLFHVELSNGIAFLLLFLLCCLAVVKAVREKQHFIILNAGLVVFFIVSFAAVGSMRFPHYYGSIMLSGYVLLAYLLPLKPRCIYCWVILIVIPLIFIFTNRYAPAFQKTSSQIEKARDVSQNIALMVKRGPIQLATIPSTETDEHYRYFLQKDYPEIALLGKYDTDAPNELYVLCFTKTCNPLGDGQWHIAAFTNKTLGGKKKITNITIYQLLHGNATIR